ncbi:MAG TPA: STAS domain-containing protein, partial [Luteimonas sp.]|nr:STAS domain-containing protein [Luteimonas sp.]
MSHLIINAEPTRHDVQSVALGGRLDTHTAGELDQTLAPLLEVPALRSLVLDLRALEYISSAGVRSIFRARKALAGRGGRVLVVNPQPQIQKVFDLVKAVPLEDIFSSTAEADAYLAAMQRKVLEGDDDD